MKIADNKSNSGRVFSYFRWSTAQQEWGDSERRQNKMAEEWCAREGLHLSDQRFVDSGLSAFHGKNQRGDLGRLLATVQRGDTLLVEDCDRLSRQDWFSSLSFLQSILGKGVTVVTLRNGNIITEETFRHNSGVFLMAIGGTIIRTCFARVEGIRAFATMFWRRI
jgi:DNA invertase Pin-like site-specific DNA recombinase